eukprot:8087767-Lingulodinium_polyedra.AAC.2
MFLSFPGEDTRVRGGMYGAGKHVLLLAPIPRSLEMHLCNSMRKNTSHNLDGNELRLDCTEHWQLDTWLRKSVNLLNNNAMATQVHTLLQPTKGRANVLMVAATMAPPFQSIQGQAMVRSQNVAQH